MHRILKSYKVGTIIRWENWDTEKLFNLPKVMYVVSNGV